MEVGQIIVGNISIEKVELTEEETTIRRPDNHFLESEFHHWPR